MPLLRRRRQQKRLKSRSKQERPKNSSQNQSTVRHMKPVTRIAKKERSPLATESHQSLWIPKFQPKPKQNQLRKQHNRKLSHQQLNQLHPRPLKRPQRRHLVQHMALKTNVKVCLARMTMIVQVPVAVQPWVMDPRLATL